MMNPMNIFDSWAEIGGPGCGFVALIIFHALVFSKNNKNWWD